MYLLKFVYGSLITNLISDVWSFEFPKFLSFDDQNKGYFHCPHPINLFCENTKYRTIDGSCNNLVYTTWAKTETSYIRIFPAHFADGKEKIRRSVNGSELPLARKIRTTLFPNKDIRSNEFNIFFYGFGQYVTHDITNAVNQISPESCCSLDGKRQRFNAPQGLCLPTVIPKDDPFYSQFGVGCIDFKRHINTRQFGCDVSPVFAINFQTGYLDLSILYGPMKALSDDLREFRGGRLKTLLPSYHKKSYPPIAPACPFGGLTAVPLTPCFLTGSRTDEVYSFCENSNCDYRVNQNPELTSVGILFLRSHNYIADQLALINPKWNDEILFQEARRILIALYQHVIYNELVPLMIGPTVSQLYQLPPLKFGYRFDYNVLVNGQTTMSFEAAAARVFHSMVRDEIKYSEQQSYRLKDTYFNQGFMLNEETFTNIVDAYSNQLCNKQDVYSSKDVTDYLFKFQNKYGNDLDSIDINRGRDHGIPPYIVVRKRCGLSPINSFEELNTIFEDTDGDVVAKLKQLYNSVEDIDYYVGGLLEKKLPGAVIGPSLACVIADGFYRWKFGDRYYYEFNTIGAFTPDQLQSIRKATFSSFLCMSSGNVSFVPENGFLSSYRNKQIPCSQVDIVDLNLWRTVF